MTLTTALLQIFLFQIIVIGIIVFILGFLLNHSLMESAVHRFEVMFASEFDPQLPEVVVVVANQCPSKMLERIERSAAKKRGQPVKVTIRREPRIKGGMIILLNQKLIDFSLLKKLQESGFVKN